MVNGILYVLRAGWPRGWRPQDLPPWQTLYKYFRRWSEDGTWERVHETTRPMVREAEGRDSTPGAAIVESQSVRAKEKGGLGAMTQARKSADGGGISSQIPRDCCWRW